MNNNSQVLTTTQVSESGNHYIVFNLKDKQYAVNIEYVIEVINFPEIEIPQNTPLGIIGILKYNGTVINVIDLCPLLGFETSKFSINNQLIITCCNGVFYALHTEKIINISDFDLKYIHPLPFNSDNSILKEVYKVDNNSSVNIIEPKSIEFLINKNIQSDVRTNYSEFFPDDEKSSQIFKMRTIHNENIKEMFSFPVNYSANQYILFQCGNQNFYLDLKYVKEFISLKRLNITKLPYTQDFIMGIINVKGDFLVVIDLKRFLNNEKSEIKEGSKLIIAEGKNFNIALLVDEIKHIKNLKNIYSLNNSNFSSEYISFEFTENNQLFSILNFEKIINDERIYINTSK